MVSFLLPCATPWLALLSVRCVRSATPRGQPWMPALTRPHGRDGWSVRWIAVCGTFRLPSRGRHVHRQLLRTALPNFTTIVPVTVYH
jgi:hypothetical protein